MWAHIQAPRVLNWRKNHLKIVIYVIYHELKPIPTPKKSGAMKMAEVGPVHGTSMGSMEARNTSSSVSGATALFLSQHKSLKQSATFFKPIVNCTC